MSPDRTDLPAAADVVIKGVRDEPSPDDGRRVLADRLWPRGVSKERAALDEWAKDATPSTALRRAFHSGDLAWEQFVPAYRAELEEEPAAREAVDGLRAEALSGRVTLLIAGHDRNHTHARVLREAVLGVDDSDLPR